MHKRPKTVSHNRSSPFNISLYPCSRTAEMRKIDPRCGHSTSNCNCYCGTYWFHLFELWYLTSPQTSLLAGALVSLAQIVAGAVKNGDTSSPSWDALYVFVYSAIMLNIGTAFFSLFCVKLCSDLPLAAQQRLLREDNAISTSTLSRIARGETLDVDTLGDHFGLLRSMGMSPWYRMVDLMSSWLLILACVCTFIALTFWVFLSESISTAGVTMVVFGPVAILIILVFALASLGQGWK